MKTLLRIVALVAVVLAVGALAAGPAAAWDKHRRHGWHHGHRHHHGFHRHGKRVVVFVRPHRRVVRLPRVIVVPAQPVQVIRRVAPVAVPALGPVRAAYCREYIETVVIGGVQHSAYGTACLQADGSWRKAN